MNGVAQGMETVVALEALKLGPAESSPPSHPSHSPASDGERLVSAYLRWRSLAYEFEPEIGGRNLDFLVDSPWGPIVLEVYEPQLKLPNRAGSFDSIEPITKAFEARKRLQIRAVKNAGFPLVMVIASTNSDIAFDSHALQGAMHGRPGVRFPLDSDDPGADAEWTFLDGARVQPERNRGVAALALVRRFNPTRWRLEAAWRERGLGTESAKAARSQGDLADKIEAMREIERALIRRGVFDPEAAVARLIIHHNPYAAYPIPREFAGVHDDQFATLVDDGQVLWTLVAQGVRRWEVPA